MPHDAATGSGAGDASREGLLLRLHPVRRLLHLFYVHLVKPVIESRAPLGEVTWGATMGMLIGLTPTMGIQLYLTTFVWVLSRYLLRFRFNLAVAIGMVWITNPVTVLPLYYLYLITGDWVLSWWGNMPARGGYGDFADVVRACCDASGEELWQRLGEGALFLWVEFGWPIVVGSLTWAVPVTLLTFPVTYFGVKKYRALQAGDSGVPAA